MRTRPGIEFTFDFTTFISRHSLVLDEAENIWMVGLLLQSHGEGI